MPRILPRLLEALKKSSSQPQIRPLRHPGLKPKLPKSLWRADVPQFPWSRERVASVLLDEANPVMHQDTYTKHKMLPPLVHLPPQQGGNLVPESDRPRAMTAEERGWFASPYRTSSASSSFLACMYSRRAPKVRMLSGTLRNCMATNHHLPMGASVAIVFDFVLVLTFAQTS